MSKAEHARMRECGLQVFAASCSKKDIVAYGLTAWQCSRSRDVRPPLLLCSLERKQHDGDSTRVHEDQGQPHGQDGGDDVRRRDGDGAPSIQRQIDLHQPRLGSVCGSPLTCTSHQPTCDKTCPDATMCTGATCPQALSPRTRPTQKWCRTAQTAGPTACEEWTLSMPGCRVKGTTRTASGARAHRR